MTDEPLVQLINYDSNFVGDIEGFLKRKNLYDRGLDYSVVTVLGCQSSGKSTLLNALFGTAFETLDAARGRQQTTKGLWLGRDRDTPTIICDVEGTDSNERGEDRATFEHRAALFSLAITDLLIVNMWYHDIGRYSGSNMGLLKTVFAVNLELFQQQDQNGGKTVLLFIIRDHSEEQTSLSRVEQMLRKDVRHIWKEIAKPEGFADKDADDVFDFHVEGLPSYFSSPQEFRQAVEKLRRTWLNELRPKTYSRQVPSDGFSFYLRNVWATILSSAAVDIPTQKEMLASFRCDEIRASILGEVEEEIKGKAAEAEAGKVGGFARWGGGVLLCAVGRFDDESCRYHQRIANEKRKQLIESLAKELQPIVARHLSHMKDDVVRETLRELSDPHDSADKHNAISERINAWQTFARRRNELRRRGVEILQKGGEECALSVPPPARMGSSSTTANASNTLDSETLQKGDILLTFSAKESAHAFIEAYDLASERIRDRELLKLKEAMTVPITRELEPLESLLSQPMRDGGFPSHAEEGRPQRRGGNNDEQQNPHSDTLCKNIAELIQSASHRTSQEFKDAVIGLNPDIARPSEGDEFSTDQAAELFVLLEVVKLFRLRLEREGDVLEMRLVTIFQHFFHNDNEGVPRHWPSMTQERISVAFKEAKAKTYLWMDAILSLGTNLAPLLLSQVFNQEGPDASLAKLLHDPVVTSAKEQVVRERVERAMLKSCQEAQLIQATGGTGTKIPVWMYALLLLFGWNEIVMIFSSPFVFIPLLAMVTMIAYSYYTGNITVLVSLGKQALGMGTTALVPLLTQLQQALVVPDKGGGGVNSTTREKRDKED